MIARTTFLAPSHRSCFRMSLPSHLLILRHLLDIVLSDPSLTDITRPFRSDLTNLLHSLLECRPAAQPPPPPNPLSLLPNPNPNVLDEEFENLLLGLSPPSQVLGITEPPQSGERKVNELEPLAETCSLPSLEMEIIGPDTTRSWMRVDLPNSLPTHASVPQSSHIASTLEISQVPQVSPSPLIPYRPPIRRCFHG